MASTCQCLDLFLTSACDYVDNGCESIASGCLLCILLQVYVHFSVIVVGVGYCSFDCYSTTIACIISVVVVTEVFHVALPK